MALVPLKFLIFANFTSLRDDSHIDFRIYLMRHNDAQWGYPWLLFHSWEMIIYQWGTNQRLKLWVRVPIAVSSCPAAVHSSCPAAAHMYTSILWTNRPSQICSSSSRNNTRVKTKEISSNRYFLMFAWMQLLLISSKT